MNADVSTLTGLSAGSRSHSWRDATRSLARFLATLPHVERLLRDSSSIGPDAAAALVRSVNLVIEPRCNLRCGACHYWRAHDSVPLRRGELDRLLAIVDEVPQASVAITGGEPLLAPATAVRAAQHLLAARRVTSVVTNGLPIVDPRDGAAVRACLRDGLAPDGKARLCVRCSVDRMHQEASGLGPAEYASACREAVEFLVGDGYRVVTRSVVTSGADYQFFLRHVAPISAVAGADRATVQPDIFDAEAFVAAYEQREFQRLPGVSLDYLSTLRAYLRGDGDDAEDWTHLRALPWTLVEVSGAGVRGPSCFVAMGGYHESVTTMLQSYEWLAVSEAVVPQITITRNASAYRVHRRTLAVRPDWRVLLRRALGPAG